MNLNMNIQTILSKYPSNISDKANQIFNQPLDYSNCQNDFFQDVYALAFKREVFVAHSIQLQS